MPETVYLRGKYRMVWYYDEICGENQRKMDKYIREFIDDDVSFAGAKFVALATDPLTVSDAEKLPANMMKALIASVYEMDVEEIPW